MWLRRTYSFWSPSIPTDVLLPGGSLSRAHSVSRPPCMPRQRLSTWELFFWVDVVSLYRLLSVCSHCYCHFATRASADEIRTSYYIHRRCNNILCSFHSRPPDTYNAIPNYNHDFLILQMSDATEEGTFLAAAQPFEDIIAYIGAVPLYRFGKKQELIDALLLHMAYTRKRTALIQYVHELISKKLMGEQLTRKPSRLGECPIE